MELEKINTLVDIIESIDKVVPLKGLSNYAQIKNIDLDMEKGFFKLKTEDKAIFEKEITIFTELVLNEIYENIENVTDKFYLADVISKLIESANLIYRSGQVEIMTDDVYDGQENVVSMTNTESDKRNFYRLLQKLNPEHTLFSEHLMDTPLKDEDGKLVYEQVEHAVTGNTMKKETTTEGFENSFNSLLSDRASEDEELEISEKLDGSSLYLTYSHTGELLYGATRGNGDIGEKITANALKMKGVNKNIDVSKLDLKEGETIEIRGEMLLENEDFEELNKIREEEGLPLYSNPRNTTSGIARELEGSNCNYITYRAFEVIKVSEDKEDTKRIPFKEKNDFFEENNIKQPKTWLVKSFKEFQEIYDAYENGSDRYEALYQIDGLIVNKYTDTYETDNQEASHAFASKFSPIIKKLQVLDIEYSTGKTGAISRVIKFEPTVVDGVEVSRASLADVNSEDILSLMGTINKGDYLYVGRMGDVIPKALWNSRYDDLYIEMYHKIEETIMSETLIELLGDCNTKIVNKLKKVLNAVTVMKTTPENKDFNLLIKTFVAETLVNNPKYDFKKLINSTFAKIIKIVEEEIKKDNREELSVIKYTDKNVEKKIKESTKLIHKEELKDLALIKKELTNKSKKIESEFDMDESLTKGFEHITVCPSCNEQLSGIEKGSKTIECTNQKCEGVIKSTISAYVQIMGIKAINISDKTIEFLYETGRIKDIADLYKLNHESFKEDGEWIKDWGEKRVINFFESIDRIKTADDNIFMKSLNIRGFSESNSTKLLQNHSLNELLELDLNNEEVYQEWFKKVSKIKTLGEITAKDVLTFLKENKERIVDVLQFVKIGNETNILTDEEKNAVEMPCVVTGSVEAGSIDINGEILEWTDRKTFTKVFNKKIINGKEIKIVGSPSGNTNYVITDDAILKEISKLVEDGKIDEAKGKALGASNKIKKVYTNKGIEGLVTSNGFKVVIEALINEEKAQEKKISKSHSMSM